MADIPPTLRQLTDNTILVLVSRLMQVAGIPLAGGLLWFGLTIVSGMSDKVNNLTTSVATIQTELNERTTDRYTATDARHDFYDVAIQMNDLDRRVGVLEGKPSTYRPLTVKPPSAPTLHAVIP